MPCYHPIMAFHGPGGRMQISKDGGIPLPCSKCLGCFEKHARDWALRCQLELTQHPSALFTTLTFRDETLPPTIAKRDLQLFLKRLRKIRGPTRPVRFFGSGEYGETTGRPHYHAILFGMDLHDSEDIDRAWTLGHVRTGNLEEGGIRYIARYTAKKYGDRFAASHERVDPETGEVYYWQPPFIQMSRRPGLGACAREYAHSWRLFAVMDGHKMPVPRYLHEAWKKTATQEQQEETKAIKKKFALQRTMTELQLMAAEKIAIAKQKQNATKRKY